MCDDQLVDEQDTCRHRWEGLSAWNLGAKQWASQVASSVGAVICQRHGPPASQAGSPEGYQNCTSLQTFTGSPAAAVPQVPVGADAAFWQTETPPPAMLPWLAMNQPS